MKGTNTDRGLVFDIQRFSIHDGPGIRTTVFLKGCPLSCLWCHNPEGQEATSEMFFTPAKCVGCLSCVRMCERKCHRAEGGRHVYDRQTCVRCGACVRGCYAGALEIAGKEMTVEEVLREVEKDKPFYGNSGGGMTVSGGEPLLQHAFARALLKSARAAGLHICLETSGWGSEKRVLSIASFVDLFLYDVKDTDPARHRKHTGVPNDQLLANLAALDRKGARIILRCPVIPGINDRPDHFRALGRLADVLHGVEAVEVLPYHALGTSKSQRLGRTPRLPDLSAPSDATVQAWLDAIRGATSKPVRRN